MLPIVSTCTALVLLGVTVSGLGTPWIVTLEQRRNSSGQMLVEKQCRGVAIDGRRVLTVASCIQGGCSEVELIVAGSCTEPERKIFNVTVHPTADLAIITVHNPFPINETSVDFPDFKKKSPEAASLDTSSGMQEVPLVEDDRCSKTLEKLPQDKLYVASQCDTSPGSPLFDQENVLIGLVSSIPSNCHNTSCRIHLTDVSHYQEWLTEQFADDESAPSIKLPKVPATVVFSFLKLLAVVSSLGGISFAFCCVMFLISN